MNSLQKEFYRDLSEVLAKHDVSIYADWDSEKQKSVLTMVFSGPTAYQEHRRLDCDVCNELGKTEFKNDDRVECIVEIMSDDRTVSGYDDGSPVLPIGTQGVVTGKSSDDAEATLKPGCEDCVVVAFTLDDGSTHNFDCSPDELKLVDPSDMLSSVETVELSPAYGESDYDAAVDSISAQLENMIDPKFVDGITERLKKHGLEPQ